MEKLIKLIILCLVITFFFVGCATSPPPPTRIVSFPVQKEKLPLTCALIQDSSLCGNNIQTLTYPGGGYLVHHEDLSDRVLANAQKLIEDLCLTVIKISPEDQNAIADFFIIPSVESSITETNGITIFADCTFTINIALTFLDQNRIQVFDMAHLGHAYGKMGNAWILKSNSIERANNAIIDSMLGLRTAIEQNHEYRFFIDHLDFFKMDDTAKSNTIENLFSEDQIKNSIGPMLMAYAIRANNTQFMETLIKKGISPKIPHGIEGRSPLHWAALSNNVEAINLLIEHGADVNIEDNNGFSPLYYADSKGFQDLADVLLSKGANIDLVDKKNIDETTTLSMIAKERNHSAIADILQAGSLPKLHFAAITNDLSKLEALIIEGADINEKTSDGLTSFHIAAEENHKDIALFLLDSGAQVDILEEYPEITSRSFSLASEYYFSKNDSQKAIEHFEIASQYSEKASHKHAENSVKFKAANVTIGVVVGAIGGGLIGALAGKSEYVKAGVAAGALIGGGIGYHGEKKRLHFATEEARIEAIQAHINDENQRLTQYVALTKKFIDDAKERIVQINHQLVRGEKSMEDAKAELAKIQSNREQLAVSIAAFKIQKEKYTELIEAQRSKSSQESVAVLDNRIKELETELSHLEKDLVALDEVLKLSKVG